MSLTWISLRKLVCSAHELRTTRELKVGVGKLVSLRGWRCYVCAKVKFWQQSRLLSIPFKASPVFSRLPVVQTLCKQSRQQRR